VEPEGHFELDQIREANMKKRSPFIEFLVTVLWPFIRDELWPILKDEILALIKMALEDQRQRYEDILNERQRKREEQARARAQAAEEQAAKAQDAAEAEKFRAIAEVWRQIAEDFRVENDSLKQELSKATQSVLSKAEQTVQDMRIETEKGKASLKSGDKIIALPAPSNKG
jgi:flagellar biosynthesis regulator FlaF